MNTLLKLLCLMMNERMDNYLQNNNIINKTQIGFQRGNRTTDHILTLKSVVNKYIYDNKSNLYACFIDFKKTSDSVNRQTLFYKLREMVIFKIYYKVFINSVNVR